MPLITSQKISRYFELFSNVEVSFNKEVVKAIKLNPTQIFLKCLGEQWPCVIFSTSLLGAKVVVSMKSEMFEKVRKANNLVSLRFSFKQVDKSNELSFFVSSKITGFNSYNKGNPDLNFVNLSYTQRPPDDLISILGQLLEATINAKKRNENRILLTADNIKKLGLKSKNGIFYVQNVPRNCIIRDLSFSGAKIIVVGVPKFLVKKEVILKIESFDRATMEVPGNILRFEQVEGRKDLAAIAINYAQDKIPVEYKMMINEFIESNKKFNE